MMFSVSVPVLLPTPLFIILQLPSLLDSIFAYKIADAIGAGSKLQTS